MPCVKLTGNCEARATRPERGGLKIPGDLPGTLRTYQQQSVEVERSLKAP